MVVCENLETESICHCAIGSSGDNCETIWLTYALLTGIRDTVSNVFEVQKKRSTKEVSYQLYKEAKTRYQAVSACEREGDQLAMIRSADEQARAIRVKGSEKRFIWLGATDEDHEGTWFDLNQNKVSYNEWSYDQPNNHGNNQNSLTLFAVDAAQKWWIVE